MADSEEACLTGPGSNRTQAEAVADVLRDANSDLAPRTDIEHAVAPLATRASLYPTSDSRPEPL